MPPKTGTLNFSAARPWRRRKIIGVAGKESSGRRGFVAGMSLNGFAKAFQCPLFKTASWEFLVKALLICLLRKILSILIF